MYKESTKEVLQCGWCNGHGVSRDLGAKCLHCEGRGAKYACHELSCAKHGCQYGTCVVDPLAAARKGFPLSASDPQAEPFVKHACAS